MSRWGGIKKSSGSGRKFTSKVPVPEVPVALRDEVDLWLKDSDDSLKVAKDNMALGNYYVAALYTHQVVEKALKAAIIALKPEIQFYWRYSSVRGIPTRYVGVSSTNEGYLLKSAF